MVKVEGLNQEEYDLVKHYVPNGITHHNDLLYVTGKNWSKLFLIRLVRLK